MKKEFKHIQAAHCENGVGVSLLKYHGLEFVTEPLIFGMGSGLLYLHLPLIKINNGPFITFRTMPGKIFSTASKSMGIKVSRTKFGSEVKAMNFLDKKVQEGVPVGCQVGVFNLPYFPPEYRFHFNAHNLIVYGKENGNYLVSDPVMETVTTLSEEDMIKVRFAKGPLAPRGQIYFPENVHQIDTETIRNGIIKGIKRTNLMMLDAPGGIIGVNGIKYTARQILKWREKMGPRKAGLYLGQIVRMQEEIGTGGGGFRFIYAAFLEQAAAYVKNDRLLEISEEFTKSGDLWRESAIQMGRIYKGRINNEQADFKVCADLLMRISDVEKQAFLKLRKLKLK